MSTLRQALGLVLLLALAAVALSGHGRQVSPSSSAETLALVGAAIVDLYGGPARPATVLIEGGRVAAVAPPPQVAVPSSARVVDVAGTFVIPGLWDMHAHTTHSTVAEVEQVFFPVLVAHGVLGIRDPASRFPVGQTVRWRRAIAEGRLIGPRLAALGRVVDARATTVGTVVVRNAAEAERAVAAAHTAGYDFIKPYNDLSADAYRALAREAARLGLPLAGHIPYGVAAREAAALGQRSIEHLTNLWFDVSSAEGAIRQRILRGLAGGERPEALFAAKIDELFPLAFRGHDPAKERELFAAFARHGTWQVPTLVVDRHMAGADGRNTEAATRLVPRWLRTSGGPLERFLAALSPEQRATLAELYRREAAMVGRMHRAGVGILAGSDSPLPYLAPGAALHEELEALVRDAGLTPIEALRAATVNPARYFQPDAPGIIAPGQPADLVLLNADPAADISNVAQISAVVAQGRYFDRAALDALLAAAGRAVR